MLQPPLFSDSLQSPEHSIETLAYVAGLFDAEGNIHVRAWYPSQRNNLKTPSYQLQVQVNMTDYAVMNWLHTTFIGGGLADCTLTPSHVKNGFRPIWHWQLRGPVGQQFLECILPYLKVKQRQAELAIEFQRYNTQHSRWFQEHRTKEVTECNEVYYQNINSMSAARKPWIGDPSLGTNNNATFIASSARSVENLSYIAGFFDGEGNIEVSLVRLSDCIHPLHRLRIRLTNINQAILKWVQEIFHGNLEETTFTPSRAKNERRHPSWSWTLRSNNAQQFLELLLPYLKVKEQQAMLAIAFQQYHHTHPLRGAINPSPLEILRQREEYRQQIHQLNLSRKPLKRFETLLD